MGSLESEKKEIENLLISIQLESRFNHEVVTLTEQIRDKVDQLTTMAQLSSSPSTLKVSRRISCTESEDKS